MDSDYQDLLKITDESLIQHFSTPYPNGVYAVVEGPNKNGKSTLVSNLVKHYSRAFPHISTLEEPGGDEIANDLRDMVQGLRRKNYKVPMLPQTTFFLYTAARAQLIRSEVVETLDNNGLAINSRDFVSSLLFQGIKQGLGLEYILGVTKYAIGNILPHLYLNIDLPGEEVLKREQDDNDIWETKDLRDVEFIRQAYLDVGSLPIHKGRWVNLNGMQGIDELFEDAKGHIDKLIESILHTQNI